MGGRQLHRLPHGIEEEDRPDRRLHRRTESIEGELQRIAGSLGLRERLGQVAQQRDVRPLRPGRDLLHRSLPPLPAHQP